MGKNEKETEEKEEIVKISSTRDQKEWRKKKIQIDTDRLKGKVAEIERALGDKREKKRKREDEL